MAKTNNQNSFKAIIMATEIGKIFCKSKKDKNDWKVRMLKAGLENRGFNIPNDWNKLSENEKEKRLNRVIKQLA